MSRLRGLLLVAAVATLAACKTPDPPDGFGVNLTVSVATDLRAGLTALDLKVSGDETFEKKLDASAVSDGEARIHYVPGITSGTLTFTIDAFAGSTRVGGGSSGPVTLVPGAAVAATVTVAGGGGTGVCTPPCGGGMFCGPDSVCHALKQAGDACAGQLECLPGLTCIDGVCCTVAVCPQCMNCGAQGMCVDKVADKPDPTGNACDNAMTCDANSTCKIALGQKCGGDGDCASGHCVDGVCCGVAECPQCMNCGGDGTCSVAVQNADDTTGKTCDGDNSCDGTGACKQRWMSVQKVPGYKLGNFGAVGTDYNFIYYQAANETKGHNYDVQNGTTTDTGPNSDICGCGFGGTLFQAGGRLFWFGNSAFVWDITAGSNWMNATAPPQRRGEAGFAGINGNIYMTGGRDINNVDQATLQIFTTTTGAWSTGPDCPVALDEGVGGTINNLFYVFGTRNLQSGAGPMYAYNPSNMTWAKVADTLPFQPQELNEMYAWGTALVAAGYMGIFEFSPANNTWNATPIGWPSGLMNHKSVVVGNQLFAVGDAPGTTVGTTDFTIYKYVFGPAP